MAESQLRGIHTYIHTYILYLFQKQTIYTDKTKKKSTSRKGSLEVSPMRNTFMPNLEKRVRTAVVEGKNWKQELYKFLTKYSATPHTTTNVSPNEALNGRKLKTTLPEVSPASARQNTLQETRKTMAERERDAEQKSKIKVHTDSKLGTKPSDIKPGDSACETTKEEQTKHFF